MDREIIIEARKTFDPYDRFAWVQEWRFALLGFLWWRRGLRVPGFQPGLHEMDPEHCYPYELLLELDKDRETLTYTLRVLDRYSDWLSQAGIDY